MFERREVFEFEVGGLVVYKGEGDAVVYLFLFVMMVDFKVGVAGEGDVVIDLFLFIVMLDFRVGVGEYFFLVHNASTFDKQGGCS